MAWLRRHEALTGRQVEADVDLADPLVAAAADLIVVGGGRAPARVALREALNGSKGITGFPHFQTHDNLGAIRAYLHLYASSRRHCARTRRNWSASCSRP